MIPPSKWLPQEFDMVESIQLKKRLEPDAKIHLRLMCDGMHLAKIPKDRWTEDMKLTAVRENWRALKLIENPSDDVIRAATDADPAAADLVRQA